jgi:hypothetical protein
LSCLAIAAIKQSLIAATWPASLFAFTVAPDGSGPCCTFARGSGLPRRTGQEVNKAFRDWNSTRFKFAVQPSNLLRWNSKNARSLSAVTTASLTVFELLVLLTRGAWRFTFLGDRMAIDVARLGGCDVALA